MLSSFTDVIIFLCFTSQLPDIKHYEGDLTYVGQIAWIYLVHVVSWMDRHGCSVLVIMWCQRQKGSQELPKTSGYQMLVCLSLREFATSEVFCVLFPEIMNQVWNGCRKAHSSINTSSVAGEKLMKNTWKTLAYLNCLIL